MTVGVHPSVSPLPALVGPLQYGSTRRNIGSFGRARHDHTQHHRAGHPRPATRKREGRRPRRDSPWRRRRANWRRASGCRLRRYHWGASRICAAGRSSRPSGPRRASFCVTQMPAMPTLAARYGNRTAVGCHRRRALARQPSHPSTLASTDGAALDPGARRQCRPTACRAPSPYVG